MDSAHDIRTQRQRRLICEAAILMVQEAGAGKLTLETVADAADLPCPEVREHYTTIDALIVDIVPGIFAAMRERLEAHQGSSEAPGAWLHAYVEAHFPSDGSEHFASIVTALLASTGFKPEFVQSLKDQQDELHAALLNDGVDEATACIVRSACDGLWMSRVFDIDLVPWARLQQTINDLHDLIERAASER